MCISGNAKLISNPNIIKSTLKITATNFNKHRQLTENITAEIPLVL